MTAKHPPNISIYDTEKVYKDPNNSGKMISYTWNIWRYCIPFAFSAVSNTIIMILNKLQDNLGSFLVLMMVAH